MQNSLKDSYIQFLRNKLRVQIHQVKLGKHLLATPLLVQSKERKQVTPVVVIHPVPQVTQDHREERLPTPEISNNLPPKRLPKTPPHNQAIQVIQPPAPNVMSRSHTRLVYLTEAGKGKINPLPSSRKSESDPSLPTNALEILSVPPTCAHELTWPVQARLKGHGCDSVRPPSVKDS